jgi:hypothetical protein
MHTQGSLLDFRKARTKLHDFGEPGVVDVAHNPAKFRQCECIPHGRLSPDTRDCQR